MKVVSGTARTSPIDPTRVRTISPAKVSLRSTSPSGIW
jgi:hypothetical protein